MEEREFVGTTENVGTSERKFSREKRRCGEQRSEKPTYLRERERIMYPRNTRVLTKTAVVGGRPIDEETCMALRTLVFGSCASPPKPEWAKTGLTLRPYGQNLAFGIRAPRNTTRGLITAVQAVMLKYFLFEVDSLQDGRMTPADTLLKASYSRQVEVLCKAISEIVWRCAVGHGPPQSGTGSLSSVASNVERDPVPTAVVALPQETPYLQHSVQYFQDGLTETLHLFEFRSRQDLDIFVKRYLYLFQDEGGPGAKLLLYSAVLSRGLVNVRNDLEDPKASLLAGCPEEGPASVVIFALTGRASPHLHNGVLHIGDENTYAVPRWGVLARSEIGVLVYESDGRCTNKQPGSRLKTPSLPIWVTLCLGHYGVLFNTNRELLRNYHAERRFEVQYYTCGGNHVALTVDTRANDSTSSSFERSNDSGSATGIDTGNGSAGSGNGDGGTGGDNGDNGDNRDSVDFGLTPLEKLIRSKWQDAQIQWNGTPMI